MNSQQYMALLQLQNALLKAEEVQLFGLSGLNMNNLTVEEFTGAVEYGLRQHLNGLINETTSAGDETPAATPAATIYASAPLWGVVFTCDDLHGETHGDYFGPTANAVEHKLRQQYKNVDIISIKEKK